MFEAAPRAIHAATRAPADVEAELGIVARLLSGLPTHVHAGEYAAALAAHLASSSDALRQELHRNEHAPASGATGGRPCAWVPTGFSRVLTGYSPQSVQCVGYDATGARPCVVVAAARRGRRPLQR